MEAHKTTQHNNFYLAPDKLCRSVFSQKLSAYPHLTNLLKTKIIEFSTVLTIILFATHTTSAAHPPTEDICKKRAEILGSVARERDRGESKSNVKKKIGKRFANLWPYVDFVYKDAANLSPPDIETLTLYSCLKE